MNHWSVGTGLTGRTDRPTSPWATLSDSPHCADGGADYTIVARTKPQRAACPDN